MNQKELVTIRGIAAVAFLLAATSTITFPNVVFSQTDDDTFSQSNQGQIMQDAQAQATVQLDASTDSEVPYDDEYDDEYDGDVIAGDTTVIAANIQLAEITQSNDISDDDTSNQDDD